MKTDRLVQIFPSRIRRKLNRGLKPKHLTLIKKLRKVKMAVLGTKERPETINTHLRDMIIVPEMVGSIVGVYNGKRYLPVEIKPHMIGLYLGEFSLSYKPPNRGKTGSK